MRSIVSTLLLGAFFWVLPSIFGPVLAQIEPNKPNQAPIVSSPEAGASDALQSAPGGMLMQPGQDPQPSQDPQDVQDLPKSQETQDADAGVEISPLDQWKLTLEQLQLTLVREGLTEEDFAQIEERIEPIRTDALSFASELDPRLSALRDQQEQLGVPEEGKPENEALKEQQALLKQEIDDIDSMIRQARLIAVEVEQLRGEIAQIRRARFANQLAERQYSVLSPNLWIEGVGDIAGVWRSTGIIFGDALGAIKTRIREGVDFLFFLGLLGAIIFPLIVRNIARHLTLRDPNQADVSRLEKLRAAAWLTLVYGIVPAAAAFAAVWSLVIYDILPKRLHEFAGAIAVAIAVLVTTTALMRAVLAPGRPAWRLVDVPNAAIGGVEFGISIATFALVAEIVLGRLFDLTAAPLAITILTSALVSLVTALALASAVSLITRSRIAARAVAGEDDGEEDPSVDTSERYWRWFKVVFWLGCLVIVGSTITGHIALSAFVANQLFFTCVILTLLTLSLGLIDELTSTSMGDGRGLDAAVGDAVGLSRSTLTKFGILINGILRLVLIGLAGLLLLLPWGFDARQWGAWVEKLFFGFQVGGITISLSTMLSALAIFLVAVMATKGFQRWLGERFLPQTELDVGLRNSIRTATGYLGIGLAAALSVTYVGLDLANLALVAGALSVGIGFGLQSIVNNFVSGLILLAERPIKEGDWIIAGAAEGTVRRILIRATEIETFDRATVIVPNSDLISGSVTNMMHRNRMGRVIVSVGVSYAADPEQVRGILLDVANDHDEVLRYPEPRVFFRAFGDSSLNFDLFAYLRDVDKRLSVHSDLNFAICKRFRAAEIEIPFPQRDINIRDMDRIEAALSGRGPANLDKLT